MYKKIDIYYQGQYFCSTNQHKLCRDAKKSVCDKYALNPLDVKARRSV